jgi:acetyl coenzyme A synthetase (ADP forming)-like protein
MSLQNFFAPSSVAVVGASENLNKLGSIIFQNIIDASFDGKLYGVNPKLDQKKLLDQECYASLSAIPEAIDLAVVVVPARFVPAVIDDAIVNKTQNIIIISAGFGEVGDHEAEKNITQKCANHGINLLGPNCLGVIFPHVNLNASFSDGFPAKGDIAFISQSGAFCTAVLDWAEEKKIGFSHFVSLGNKAGISELELIESLANDPKVNVFALYLESIKDGQKLLEIIKKISPHKPVIILEPGESVAAQKASSSHTGSLAPNSKVVREAYKNAGAIQVFNMRDMFGLLEVLTYGKNKNFGQKTTIITNAGGVGVLSSDLVDESPLSLTNLDDEIVQELTKVLPAEVGLNNPIDIIGDARADRYGSALEIMSQDKNTDQILVILTPQRTTQVVETAQIIADFSTQTNKNIVASFVGGAKVAPGLSVLHKQRIPAFEFPSDAVRVMGLLSQYETWKDRQDARKNFSIDRIDNRLLSKANYASVLDVIRLSTEKNLASVPTADVRSILTMYGLDVPAAQNFFDLDSALSFSRQIFPRKVVLKISSPDALHKTELKGVFLNISDEDHFTEAWNNLMHSIEIAKLKMASIEVQEQIAGGTEVILGVNADPNFGRVMVFGSGGIYTEVFKDTTLRILPSLDFEAMIHETKIGEILSGVRGEEPKAIKKLIATMQTVQRIVHDFPQITAIDANPIFVTEDRVICVDFKMYL